MPNHTLESKQNNDATPPLNQAFKVGIIGGGVAGSTIALRLADLGIQTYLFEAKSSLIDGPPMCHLHAGGNLYREIPDEDCVDLLKQSIDMLRLYPHSIDVRPTVIAIPKRDDGNPDDLLPRLTLLTDVYREMIGQDSNNKVLGEPEEYYRLYDRDELEALIETKIVADGEVPTHTDEWVAAAASQLDLDKLKYPIVAVKEYGWNIFRLAASAQTALSEYSNMHMLLDTKVINVSDATSSDIDAGAADTQHNNHQQWRIDFKTENQDSEHVTVDYLINACGFRTGIIDNMVGVPVERMVEFKASYVTHWDSKSDNTDSSANKNDGSKAVKSMRLPEIIIHGTRGTPHGMVQLTPYPDGYYQIHSMNKAVTLFNDGLVANTEEDAQPELKPKYLDFIDEGWNPDTLHSRSQRAIDQVSEFVPRFASAKPAENALYGGQQIPGSNDTLRVTDVSLYPELNYARAENVKASSALLAADYLVKQLVQQDLITEQEQQQQARHHHQWRYLSDISKQDIDDLSLSLAGRRDFPLPMSGVVTPFNPV